MNTQSNSEALPPTAGSEIADHAIDALRKWDAAAKAADACNAYALADGYEHAHWEALSEEHDRLLTIAEEARVEVLAALDSQNTKITDA